MDGFTCPKCQGHSLEEIMYGVTVASNINSAFVEDGEISFEYGEQSNENGEVDRYQCTDCGHTIATSQEKLAEMLVSTNNECLFFQWEEGERTMNH